MEEENEKCRKCMRVKRNWNCPEARYRISELTRHYEFECDKGKWGPAHENRQ